jgi:hypothetical protein
MAAQRGGLNNVTVTVNARSAMGPQ